MKRIFITCFLITLSLIALSQKKSKNNTSSRQTQKKEYKIGDRHDGGIIYELYADGSGGRIFYNIILSDKYTDAKERLERENLWMADDYDLQKIFKLGYINPNNCGCNWTGHLWFMKRETSYSKCFTMSAASIMDLPDESSERTARIIQYGSKHDAYSNSAGKCNYLAIKIFAINR